MFDVMSSARRRFLLSRLLEADEPKRLTVLATEIAAWENDTPVEELTDRETRRVYVSIYQTQSRSWKRSVGLVAVATMLYARSILDVPGSALVPTWVVAATRLTAFLGVSVAHFVVSNRRDETTVELPVETGR